MIYAFRCEKHGEFEGWFNPKVPPRSAPCPMCGAMSRRVYSLAGVIVEMPGFKEGYDVGLDRYIKSKRQYRDEIKRLNEELEKNTGRPANIMAKG